MRPFARSCDAFVPAFVLVFLNFFACFFRFATTPVIMSVFKYAEARGKDELVQIEEKRKAADREKAEAMKKVRHLFLSVCLDYFLNIFRVIAGDGLARTVQWHW